MIIWGSTSRDNVVATGQFYCPRCRGFAEYLHHSVERYFTLYFIPLFPTGTLGEYVECGQCRGTFEPAILQLSSGEVEGLLQPWSCPSCENLNPAGEVRCLRCQAVRPLQEAPGQLPVSDGANDPRPPARLAPRPAPMPSKKKARAAEYWQQSAASDRCRECGVKFTYGDRHCRACGCDLSVR